jgi:hypothetical protein
LRSPALITIRPRTGCHAVLAPLSRRYPPLEGRSPTRYSPVCHSTQGRSPFRVRLACVRHAASVDSEPGSNSHVKGIAGHPLAERTGHLQPRAVLLALGVDSDSVMLRWSAALRPQPSRLNLISGLCLHALSSFQRTDRCLAPDSRLSASVWGTLQDYQRVVAVSTPISRRPNFFSSWPSRASRLVSEGVFEAAPELPGTTVRRLGWTRSLSTRC